MLGAHYGSLHRSCQQQQALGDAHGTIRLHACNHMVMPQTSFKTNTKHHYFSRKGSLQSSAPKPARPHLHDESRPEVKFAHDGFLNLLIRQLPRPVGVNIH